MFAGVHFMATTRCIYAKGLYGTNPHSPNKYKTGKLIKSTE